MANSCNLLKTLYLIYLSLIGFVLHLGEINAFRSLQLKDWLSLLMIEWELHLTESSKIPAYWKPVCVPLWRVNSVIWLQIMFAASPATNQKRAEKWQLSARWRDVCVVQLFSKHVHLLISGVNIECRRGQLWPNWPLIISRDTLKLVIICEASSPQEKKIYAALKSVWTLFSKWKRGLTQQTAMLINCIHCLWDDFKNN